MPKLIFRIELGKIVDGRGKVISLYHADVYLKLKFFVAPHSEEHGWNCNEQS